VGEIYFAKICAPQRYACQCIAKRFIRILIDKIMRSSYISARHIETLSPRLKSNDCNHGVQFYLAPNVLLTGDDGPSSLSIQVRVDGLTIIREIGNHMATVHET